MTCTRPQLFDVEGGEVRVVVIDGQPWWVATDVARVPDETRTDTIRTSAGPRQATFINESGLYAMALTSRKPEANRAPVLNVPAAVERRLTPPAQALLDLRKDILLHPERHALTRAEVGGPTDLYNLFDRPNCDNPSIQRLREAHHALALAVLTEYGWQDLHGPWTFDRPWIDGTWRHVPPAATRRAYLERLAALNHERAAEAD